MNTIKQVTARGTLIISAMAMDNANHVDITGHPIFYKQFIDTLDIGRIAIRRTLAKMIKVEFRYYSVVPCSKYSAVLRRILSDCLFYLLDNLACYPKFLLVKNHGKHRPLLLVTLHLGNKVENHIQQTHSISQA